MTTTLFQGTDPFGACDWDGSLDSLWDWLDFNAPGGFGSSLTVPPGAYYHMEQKSRGQTDHYIPLTVDVVDYTSNTILQHVVGEADDYTRNSWDGQNTDTISHDIGFRGSSNIDRPFGGELFPVSNTGYIMMQVDTDGPPVPPTTGPGSVEPPTKKIYFSEIKDANYRDWHSVKDTDFTSFLDTWWGIEGDAAVWAEAPWIVTYLDNTDTNPSCMMTPRWEWTDSDLNHKSGPPAELYINRGIKQNVADRRNRVRGKGRALQLHFESSTGQPFNLLGWSIHLDRNTSY